MVGPALPCPAALGPTGMVRSGHRVGDRAKSDGFKLRNAARRPTIVAGDDRDAVDEQKTRSLMHRTTRTARRTRLALLSLLLPALLVPATASAHDDDHDDVPAVVERAGLIQGVAVDSSGRGIDDLAVQALDARTGEPVASALTYASARPDGVQHGYFYLHVDPGTYDVVLVKRGYDAGLLAGVTARRKAPTSLGPITLELRDWPTTTAASVVDPVVAPKQRVRLKVEVGSRKARVDGGRVKVLEGREVLANQRLKRSDKGAVKVDLGRLPKGTHHLKVLFTGKEGLKPSRAEKVKVVVARSARHAR